jgi:uncharacterized protein (DUF3084 family)
MTGFVLIFAVACLGGVIATVGDRIGMKVGKSRLSLFNLRPRQTATLVSVATGMAASFSTLMLLIALDDQLFKGLFELKDIQSELAAAKSDLESTQSEKNDVETTLKKSTQLQKEAQSRLQQTNESLETAVAREEETLKRLLDTQSQLSSVSEQATSLRDKITDLRVERQALVEEQATVREQIAQRDSAIAQRNQQLTARNQELSQVNAELAARDQEIAERESRLEDLQTQQAFLSEEIQGLEAEFQGLRLGNVAIGRNQTLALTITRADSAAAAQKAVEDALSSANLFVAQTILPGIESVDSLAIRFDADAVEQIVSSITDRQNYVIRVSSAANYIVGEPCVNAALTQGGEPCLQVNIAAVINEVRFQLGDVLASVEIESNISNEALIERFSLLRTAAEFQARRNGIIGYQPIIASGLSDPVLDFLAQVQRYGSPLEIQAIASQPILTTGPVYLDLAAVQNGQVLFRTQNSAQ